MKKITSHLNNMLVKFNDFLEQNYEILFAIILIKEVIDEIQEKAKILNESIDIASENVEGYTKTKKDLKWGLAEALNTVTRYLQNDALKRNLNDLAKNYLGSAKTFLGLGDQKLLSKVNVIINICKNMGEDLGQTGITPELLSDLETKRSDFLRYLPIPREMRNRKKQATNKTHRLTMKLISLFHKRLDPIMANEFAKSNPELFQQYKDASHIQEISTQKLALIGRVLNIQTHTPIQGVRIRIQEINYDQRTKGKTGKFQIRMLEPGEYTMELSLESLHPQTIKFTQVWDTTTRLEILMEPTGELVRVMNTRTEI